MSESYYPRHATAPIEELEQHLAEPKHLKCGKCLGYYLAGKPTCPDCGSRVILSGAHGLFWPKAALR